MAARLEGNDARSSPADRECPICFLHYSQINVSNCCQATVCTECYLQIRSQKEKFTSCPFCNNQKMQTTVAKQMGARDVQKREEEEQKTIEAQIKAQVTAPNSSHNGSENSDSSPATPVQPENEATETSPSLFGSSLERHSTRILRARSESLSSVDVDDSCSTTSDNTSFTLTVEERRTIEAEMRAQLSHPLTRQIEEEADERRTQNELEYYRSSYFRSRTSNSAEAVLLRALASGNRRIPRRGSSEADLPNSLDDLVALNASLVLEAGDTRNEDEGSEDGEADDANVERVRAIQNARERLLRTLIAQRSGGDDQQRNSRSQTSLSARNLRDARITSRRARMSRARMPSESQLDTAGMLMRGITEEQQIALAMALSMQASESVLSTEPQAVDAQDVEEAVEEAVDEDNAISNSSPADRTPSDDDITSDVGQTSERSEGLVSDQEIQLSENPSESSEDAVIPVTTEVATETENAHDSSGGSA